MFKHVTDSVCCFYSYFGDTCSWLGFCKLIWGPGGLSACSLVGLLVLLPLTSWGPGSLLFISVSSQLVMGDGSSVIFSPQFFFFFNYYFYGTLVAQSCMLHLSAKSAVR